MGEPIESLSSDESVNVGTIRKAFTLGLVGSHKQDALGMLGCFYKDKRWVEACMAAHSFADRLVDKAIRQRQNCYSRDSKISQDHTKSQGRETLLQLLFRQFGDTADLRNEIKQFFMTAPLTVAGVLTCVCSLLAQYPDVWRQLREEALQRSQESYDYELVKSMPYMRKVLDESIKSLHVETTHSGLGWIKLTYDFQALRLFPSHSLLLRTASADTILPIGGGINGTSPIYVRKGTEIKVNILALHRVPSVFGPNPETFDPDRWDFISPKVWEYLPFGRGPRVCLGKDKAMAEVKYALTKLVRRFKEIRCAPGDDGGIGATNGRPEKCKVILVPA